MFKDYYLRSSNEAAVHSGEDGFPGLLNYIVGCLDLRLVLDVRVRQRRQALLRVLNIEVIRFIFFLRLLVIVKEVLQ